MKRLNSTEPWCTYCTALKTGEWLPRLTVTWNTVRPISRGSGQNQESGGSPEGDKDTQLSPKRPGSE